MTNDDLFIQQMNRPQNTNKVWIATIGGGAPKNILTETDAAWVETNDQATDFRKLAFHFNASLAAIRIERPV